MSRSMLVTWDDALTAYDFGPSHPMAPVRVDLTIRLARELGVFELPNVRMHPAGVADDALLGLVHTADYIQAVRSCALDPRRDCDLPHGLGSEDNPVFPNMHTASAHIVGASVAAAQAVWEGHVEHAVNVAGGLHHAMPALASGFCIYNDAAVAIRWLLEHGAGKVAYIDTDVHHGDGVERVFYDEPRVLTVSLHESGRSLFPGTGWPRDIGGPDAEGSVVNVALPPGTGDQGWLRAFHSVVPHVVEAFGPEIVVSQHGCDSHFLDPLAHLTLSVDGQRMAIAAVHDLAHRFAGGRWVALGGGGYEVVDVVPRTWTHLLAEVAGHPIDPATETPQGWREHVNELTGRVAPLRMTDGRQPVVRDWSGGYDPADWVDKAIMATRAAVFPALGLDPHVDL